jgi:hypothetical protein
MKFKKFINEKNKCPKTGCIQKKSNGKWGIISGKTGDWWNAEYDTKADAEAGLKAYFVHKNENVKFLPIKNKMIKENISDNEMFTIFPISGEDIKEVILNAKEELAKEYGKDHFVDIEKNWTRESDPGYSDEEIDDFIKNFGTYFMENSSEVFDALVNSYKKYYKKSDFFIE